MKDVQGEKDFREVELKHVGIKDIRWPIVLRDKIKGEQPSVAEITMAVDLPHYNRGTHMSRFVECLENLGNISPASIEPILDKLKTRLDAKKAMIRIAFPYFIDKKAPVSGLVAPLDIDCIYSAEKEVEFFSKIRVRVPISTLCPCSKEISKYGAHNQRAIADIEIRAKGLVWIEDLVEAAEHGSSVPIYPILKRPDEKYVTEKAYENPRFVEDSVREIALYLDKNEKIISYQITVESLESIHNHSAFACAEKGL